MAEKMDPARVRAKVTDEQDDAVDLGARLLTKRRGSAVSRADILREALALYLPTIGVEWPAPPAPPTFQQRRARYFRLRAVS